jgi:hypothetical protein
VLGSALVWIATLRVVFALRERGEAPATVPRAARERLTWRRRGIPPEPGTELPG